MTGRRTYNFPHRLRPRQRPQASQPQALPQGGLPTTLTGQGYRVSDHEPGGLLENASFYQRIDLCLEKRATSSPSSAINWRVMRYARAFSVCIEVGGLTRAAGGRKRAHYRLCWSPWSFANDRQKPSPGRRPSDYSAGRERLLRSKPDVWAAIEGCRDLVESSR